MIKNKTIIQFICYSPRIYSGFDKFNLLLAGQLKEKGIDSVFVFSDKIEVQKIADDLREAGVIIELISTRNKLTIFRDVVKLFLRYKPVVVHAHFVNFIQLLVAILSLIFGARCFITFHSVISLLSVDEYRREKGVLKQSLLRLFYRFLIADRRKFFVYPMQLKINLELFPAQIQKRSKVSVLVSKSNLSQNQKNFLDPFFLFLMIMC